MIKVYNPDLIGFSVGFGSYKWKNSHLNLAIPGDEARSVTYLRPSAHAFLPNNTTTVKLIYVQIFFEICSEW
jgi:hypothetical protein